VYSTHNQFVMCVLFPSWKIPILPELSLAQQQQQQQQQQQR
jgi:hypothetical protein